MPNTVLEQRVRAAWRARAAAAGIACGAMIFSAGAGVAVPLSLNAAALSSLPALLLSGLCAWRVARTLARPAGRPTPASRILFALLALTLSLCAAYIVAALSCLCEYTLLSRARMRFIILLTLLGVAACACCGGMAVERVCFAVRWALPTLLLALGAKALQKGHPIGLFPLLGAGAGPLAASAAAMLCGAAPALLPLCLAQDEERETPPPPPPRFFVKRVLLGGAAGTALLFSLTLCNTYDTLLTQSSWGERMLVTCTHEPRLGIPQMALVLTQMLGLGLGAAALLCAAGRAASRVAARRGADGAPPRQTARAPLFACIFAAGVAVLAMNGAGLERAVYLAPALLAPLLILLAFCGLLKGRSGETGGKGAKP